MTPITSSSRMFRVCGCSGVWIESTSTAEASERTSGCQVTSSSSSTFGRIGQAVLRRLKPFDVHLHYHDVHRLPKVMPWAMALGRSTWSDPIPAVIASLSRGAAAIRSGVRQAGGKGCEITTSASANSQARVESCAALSLVTT